MCVCVCVCVCVAWTCLCVQMYSRWVASPFGTHPSLVVYYKAFHHCLLNFLPAMSTRLQCRDVISQFSAHLARVHALCTCILPATPTYCTLHTDTCPHNTNIHTHTHTHTQIGLVPLAVTLGSYLSHHFHNAYMYTHTHTQTGLVPLAVTMGSSFS